MFVLKISLSLRAALQLDPVRRVDNTVADRIGNGWVSEDFMMPPCSNALLVEHDLGGR